MKRNDNRRILHYFIDNEGGIHVLKIYIYIYTKAGNKGNRCINKTSVLSFCLKSFWVSNLLGLGDDGI